MKGLEKFLVETILGEAAGMDKVVVVYSGRFQPFHKGHYATYDNLVRKFGKDSVYIGTSNVTDSKKSPFNFKEKKAIMMKMFGIPSNKIVQIKNPYVPQEILKKYDSDTTGLIVVVGEKDQNRLSGKYFTPYKGKVEQGYLDKGYVYASPSQSNPISGTDVRYWLSAGSSEDRKKNFTKAYPKFDDQIFKLITLKLKGLKECINEEIKLNVNIGDTLLMGKFKNKKVVVKSIGKDEWGMPTINGKKAVTFRIPKKEELKEAASTGGFTGQDEPDTSFVADGKPRILNTAKPESWYKQGGYTQLHTPKADTMRGRGKSKDTETQFRKAYYKLKNVTQSTLNPADDPHTVEDWQETEPNKAITKPKRFWELPDNQKDTIISKEDIKEIVEDFDTILDEMGLGGGAGVGLSLPGGYINGAPNPKDVKKMKSKLDAEGSEEYQPVDEAFTDLEKQRNALYSKAFKMMPKSPAQMKVRAEIDTLTKQIDKLKKENTNEMAKADMDAVEKYADQQLAPGDIELGKETDHFFQRLNDPRNGKEISPAELTGFFKRLAKNKKKFLEFVKQYKEFVVKDKRTNINIPFVVMANKLIAKTIMRKDNFKSSTPIYVTEGLLNEGGAYGHMAHPFDIEMNLTFGDLKNIVTKALNGDLDLAREKCIAGDTIIHTETNGDISIAEFVDNNIVDKVLSFNEETRNNEYMNVMASFNNDITDEWLEIELEDGKSIQITPNHRMYVDGVGYVEAKDLIEGMELKIV